jgi:hypothetical protein
MRTGPAIRTQQVRTALRWIDATEIEREGTVDAVTCAKPCGVGVFRRIDPRADYRPGDVRMWEALCGERSFLDRIVRIALR